MYRLLFTFHFSLFTFFFATVSQALPANATTRMATEAFVTNRIRTASTATNLVFSPVRWIDAIAAGNTLGAGSSVPQRTEVYAGTGIYAYGYDTTDDSNFSIQCAHGLASTNANFPNLYYGPHAHVSVAALSPPATNATFVLKWQVGSVTGSFGAVHVKTQTVYFASTHTNFHRFCDFGVITNNLLQGKDSVIFRGNIARIVGTGDTGNRVFIDSLDFHIPIDTVGSTAINGD